MEIKVSGRELDIEFTHASQGFRMYVSEWDGVDWVALPNFDGTLMLMQTQFEALCSLASDLWDEAVVAETMAELLGVEIRFYDEEEDDFLEILDNPIMIPAPPRRKI
jgi:hypothetical protein|tara:strand:- start:88 stop:408 length:321 start_codon:yes stop_codon:yes gene_type:complete